jgi:hypothetical protein
MNTTIFLLIVMLMLAASLPDVQSQQEVSLLDLTEEQITQAIASMAESALIEIIKSAGYKIDEEQENPTRDELVDAATVLTLDKKTQMEAETVGTQAASEDRAPVIEEYEDLLEQQQDQEDHYEQQQEEEDEEDVNPQAELARKHGLPDDSGFWELFKAQVMSDVAPFLAVVPAPVKAFVKDQVQHLKPALVAATGAAGPMIGVLSKVVAAGGRGLVRLSEEMEQWSQVVSERNGAVGEGSQV